MINEIFKKYCALFLIVVFSIFESYAFVKENDSLMIHSLNKSRLITIVGVETTFITGTMFGLNNMWYKDYPRSKFHLFNDNLEWLQVDKFGHAYTAYQLGRFGNNLLDYSGVSKSKALFFGGSLGMLFLSNIEILDGFSSQWGFSLGDIGANIFGSLLFIGQDAFFNEQIVSMKYSYKPSLFSQFRPNLLGANFSERLIKDYNAHTYWFSLNLKRAGVSYVPKWMNLALGYGADGMLGSFSNPSTDNQGNYLPEFNRQRQYYLSLDIDFTKIKTRNKILNTFFNVLNGFKVSAPTIEFRKSGTYFHLFH